MIVVRLINFVYASCSFIFKLLQSKDFSVRLCVVSLHPSVYVHIIRWPVRCEGGAFHLPLLTPFCLQYAWWCCIPQQWVEETFGIACYLCYVTHMGFENVPYFMGTCLWLFLMWGVNVVSYSILRYDAVQSGMWMSASEACNTAVLIGGVCRRDDMFFGERRSAGVTNQGYSCTLQFLEERDRAFSEVLLPSCTLDNTEGHNKFSRVPLRKSQMVHEGCYSEVRLDRLAVHWITNCVTWTHNGDVCSVTYRCDDNQRLYNKILTSRHGAGNM